MYALFGLVFSTAVAALSLPRASLGLGDLLNPRDNCIHSGDTCCDCCEYIQVPDLPIKLMISLREVLSPSTLIAASKTS